LQSGYSEGTVASTYQDFRTMLAMGDGTYSYRTTRGKAFFEPSEEGVSAAETMLRLLAEDAVGAPIPQMQDEVLSLLAKLQTSGLRGKSAIDPVTGMTIQVAKQLGPEQAGPYTIPNFTELTVRSAPTKETLDQILEEVNKNLPTSRRLTMGQLAPFMEGRFTIPGISAEHALSIGTTAIEEINTRSIVQAALASEVRNTIGVSSNRAAIIAGSQNMVQDILADKTILQQFGAEAESISKLVNERYTLGTIAPSNVVDLVKQVSGGNALRPLREILGDENISEEQKRGIERAYEALAKIQNRRGVPGTSGVTAGSVHAAIDIGDVLEAGIDQAGKYVGWVRGAAIAAGKMEGELPGFDPVAYAERMKGAEDVSQMHESVLQGMRDYLNDATGVPADARARVQAELERLQAMTTKDFGTAVSLVPGSPAYERYAQTAIARDISLKEAVRQKSQDMAQARFARRTPRALGVAEYRDVTRNFLNREEIKNGFQEIERINALEAAEKVKDSTLAKGLADLRRVKQKELSIQMAQGLRAIRDNYPSGNILDVMDTLEAETVSMFGQSGAKLFSDLGEEGAEDVMMKIHSLAARRRGLVSQTSDIQHFNYIQDLYRDHQGSAAADLSRVTVEQARELVRYDRRVKAPLRRMNPELFDFMTLVSRRGAATGSHRGKAVESIAATEAAIEFNKRMGLQEIQEELAALEPAASIGGVDPDDVARLAEEIGTVDPDDTVRVARSPYKRITQSFNHGELGKLLESKNVRRSGIAAIALIGASFLYQRNKKKDLTESDVAGPPLLPGGSAYDNRPPTREMIIQSAQAQSQGYGMQYQVNTTGSMNDLNRLRGLFGDVVDGPINATMYNGMPTLGKDPYSDIASNF
jgi:hypothetical protein